MAPCFFIFGVRLGWFDTSLSQPGFCLEGCVIVLACVIFSAFASTPPALGDDTMAAATIVWNYMGELILREVE